MKYAPCEAGWQKKLKIRIYYMENMDMGNMEKNCNVK